MNKAMSDQDLWDAEMRTYVRFEMRPPLGAAPSEDRRGAAKRSLGHTARGMAAGQEQGLC